jgi:hypothetical protein
MVIRAFGPGLGLKSSPLHRECAHQRLSSVVVVSTHAVGGSSVIGNGAGLIERMAQDSVGMGGLLGRFLFALILVLATYNPSGYSFYHWAANRLQDSMALVTLAGIALLIGWAVFLRATMRSLGFFGVALAAAFFAALIWVAVSYGWLELGDKRLITWIALGIVAAVLALGMSWSHVRRRLSGQADVDEVGSP